MNLLCATLGVSRGGFYRLVNQTEEQAQPN